MVSWDPPPSAPRGSVIGYRWDPPPSAPRGSVTGYRWEPPPPSAPRGSVTGYRVYYSSYADHDLERWLSVEIGPYTVSEISGLQPHTVYAVRVRAKAVDGQLGALSEVVVSNKLEHGEQ